MKTLIRFGKVVIALMIAVGSATPLDARMPMLDGLGSHTHPVTTKSAEAQKYFDQGLKLMFGFNHGAAIRSFKEAAKLDPECAMAHWGVALANGPHINLPITTRRWSRRHGRNCNSRKNTPPTRPPPSRR